MGRKIKEECGVFGILEQAGTDIAPDIFLGLTALQHRGQEACGIAVSETEGTVGNCSFRKDLGLVSEVFHDSEFLGKLKGNLGIGHVRYSTTGASVAENAQPLVLSYIKGTLGLAHNGNLINTETLKRELVRTGAIFHTTTDSEVIAFHIARERVRTATVEEAVLAAARKLAGAYSLVIMSPRKLIGMRDPWGLRPLCLGKRGPAWVLASESCALSAVDAEYVRDIEPGELISISAGGIHSDRSLQISRPAHCIFEYIYFARLDSRIDGISVYDARICAGKALAEAHPVEADMVSGVPESGLTAAMGYAEHSGIPFGYAFYKNSYVGRTFIRPTREARSSGVRMKLGVLDSAVKGKRIVLVDDSIVRGTTMANLIRMLKDAGAKEVHIRISSPPFRHPCYFGTDVPSGEELIANQYSETDLCEKLRQKLDADSLGYLPLSALPEMVKGLPICTGCFDAGYPFPVPESRH